MHEFKFCFLFERDRKEIFYLLVHFLNDDNVRVWANSKPGVQNSIQVSQAGWLQIPTHLSHHPLPPGVCTSRDLESGRSKNQPQAPPSGKQAILAAWCKCWLPTHSFQRSMNFLKPFCMEPITDNRLQGSWFSGLGKGKEMGGRASATWWPCSPD